MCAVEEHGEVEATWGTYQRTVAASREPDKAKGKQLMQAVIDAVTSGVPTEAINGRLEHLRGSALGFRNLSNYIARSLLGTGGFRPHQHPQMR